MPFRILESKTTPRGLEQVFATEAARAAEARLRQDQARYEEQRLRESRTREGAAALRRASEERKKLEVAAKQKRDAEALERFVRSEFFESAAGAGATEGDWLRVKQGLLDSAMVEGRGPVQAAKARLRRSGRYSAF